MSRAIGINPLRSGVKVEDEGLYPIQHRYWLTAMQQAVIANSKARGTVSSRRKEKFNGNLGSKRWSSSSTARRACWTTATSRAGSTVTRRTRNSEYRPGMTTTP